MKKTDENQKDRNIVNHSAPMASDSQSLEEWLASLPPGGTLKVTLPGEPGYKPPKQEAATESLEVPRPSSLEDQPGDSTPVVLTSPLPPGSRVIGYDLPKPQGPTFAEKMAKKAKS